MISVGEPEQITAFGTETVGVVVTLIVPVEVFVQVPLLPSTVYICVAAGLSTWLVPVKEPGFHV